MIALIILHKPMRQRAHMHKPRNRHLLNLHKTSKRHALRYHRVIFLPRPNRLQLRLHQTELLNLHKPALRLRRNLFHLTRMLRPRRQLLRHHAALFLLQIRRQLPMQRQIRIPPNRRREMRIILLRQPKMTHRHRIIHRPLHRPQHHHRNRRIQRMLLNRLQKLRKHIRLLNIPNLHPKPTQIRSQHQYLLRVRRLMQPRQNLNPLRP